MARYSPAFRRPAAQKRAAPKSRPKTSSSSASVLEEAMAQQIRLAKFPVPKRELRFAPPRRWRFDFAWETHRVALEVDGGTWSFGRHSRGAGFEADAEKLNAAVALGWRVLRVTGAMIRDGRALQAIEQALGPA